MSDRIERIIEGIRLTEGKKQPEPIKALFRAMETMQETIADLMESNAELRGQIEYLMEAVEKEPDSELMDECMASTQRLKEATMNMAAKVDATAAPATPYTDTFNSEI